MTWEDAAEELGKTLKLDFVSVRRLSDMATEDKSISSYEMNERAKRTARKFMAWISDHDISLQQGEDDYCWYGWHKDNPEYDWLSNESGCSNESEASSDSAEIQ